MAKALTPAQIKEQTLQLKAALKLNKEALKPHTDAAKAANAELAAAKKAADKAVAVAQKAADAANKKLEKAGAAAVAGAAKIQSKLDALAPQS